MYTYLKLAKLDAAGAEETKTWVLYDCGDTTTDGQDLASKEEKDSLNKPLN